MINTITNNNENTKDNKLSKMKAGIGKALRELFSMPYTVEEVTDIVKQIDEFEEEQSYTSSLPDNVLHDEKTFDRKREIIEDFCRNIRRLNRTFRSRSKDKKLSEEVRQKIGEAATTIDSIFWKKILGKSIEDYMWESIVIKNEATLVKDLVDIREKMKNIVELVSQK